MPEILICCLIPRRVWLKTRSKSAQGWKGGLNQKETNAGARNQTKPTETAENQTEPEATCVRAQRKEGENQKNVHRQDSMPRAGLLRLPDIKYIMHVRCL
jgi:hypothetical protein